MQVLGAQGQRPLETQADPFNSLFTTRPGQHSEQMEGLSLLTLMAAVNDLRIYILTKVTFVGFFIGLELNLHSLRFMIRADHFQGWLLVMKHNWKLLPSFVGT